MDHFAPNILLSPSMSFKNLSGEVPCTALAEADNSDSCSSLSRNDIGHPKRSCASFVDLCTKVIKLLSSARPLRSASEVLDVRFNRS